VSTGRPPSPPVEWLVEVLLPHGVGNLLYIKGKLPTRLVDPVRGGETRIAGYLRAVSAPAAMTMFLAEVAAAIGYPTLTRSHEVSARRALR